MRARPIALGLMLAVSPVLAGSAAGQQASASPCVRPQGAPPPQSEYLWGVEISTSFSKQEALDEFARAKQDHSDVLGDLTPIIVEVCNLSLGTDVQYSAQIGMETREAAEQLCAKLQASGGACIVQKN
jgi:hypothetical protein